MERDLEGPASYDFTIRLPRFYGHAYRHPYEHWISVSLLLESLRLEMADTAGGKQGGRRRGAMERKEQASFRFPFNLFSFLIWDHITR